MSKAPIGDDVPAEMTEGHEVETVFNDEAAGNVSEGLPDGLEKLRSAYQEFWSETHHSTPDARELRILAVNAEPEIEQLHQSTEVHEDRAPPSKHAVSKLGRITKTKVRNSSRQVRQRFGLPKGFIPRMQRFGRGVLLELNVYRLPNGQEFLPSLPTGTLGSRHLYALLTAEQYLGGRRGSVYVRGDGRIFDYSAVSANPLDDMFDTGYTIYDLERTGRYAPKPAVRRQITGTAGRVGRKRKKKAQQRKYRRTAAAG
jgi:hypothetical protein